MFGKIEQTSATSVTLPLDVYLPVRISTEDAQILDSVIGVQGGTRSQVIRSLIRSLSKTVSTN